MLSGPNEVESAGRKMGLVKDGLLNIALTFVLGPDDLGLHIPPPRPRGTGLRDIACSIGARLVKRPIAALGIAVDGWQTHAVVCVRALALPGT